MGIKLEFHEAMLHASFTPMAVPASDGSYLNERALKRSFLLYLIHKIIRDGYEVLSLVNQSKGFVKSNSF